MTKKTYTIDNSFWVFLAKFIIVFSIPGLVLAQESSSDESIHTLDEYIVEGLSYEDSINPLARSVASLFGARRNILDTPRGVSLINEALLRDHGIETIEETVLFSPSASAPSRFGNLTTPTIRGDVAEAYLNGQRRSANINGMQPGFNNVESIDIVRGPGSSVYGTSFYSGGYLNYITKQPHLDESFTNVHMRFGSWVPENNSFFSSLWRIDINQPLVEDTLAGRLSYAGQENETLFNANGARNDRQDIHLALTWKPNKGVKMDFNTQYSWQAIPQLLGVNRPSQELIDKGIYYTGKVDDIGGPFVEPWFLTPDGTTSIDPTDTLYSDSDFSNANVFHAQLITTVNEENTLAFTNRILFEYITRRRFHELEYVEYVDQITWESRYEFNFHPQWGGREHEVLSGITFRYEERENYINFFNEYFFNYDITRPPTDFNFSEQFSQTYFPGLPGPGGRPFFGAELFSPETTHSKLWNIGLFWQHEFELTDNLHLLYGLRGDSFFADVTDPLPPPGGDPWNDNHDFHHFSGHLSLYYKPNTSSTFYFTYNRSRAVNGSVTGGGIFLFNNQIDRNDFNNRSDLYEGGMRFSFYEHKLFVGLTAFSQDRKKVEFRGGKNDIRVQGFELESVYQPKNDFYIFSNLTFTEGHYRDSAPFQLGGRSIYDLYAPSTGPGARGTGLGYESFPGANQAPAADWRIPGMSRWLFNAGSSYLPTSGLGFRLWGSVESEQIGNLDAEFHFPTQFSLNAAISYSNPKWKAEITLYNITDETNWVHNGDTFVNNLLVSRELPFRLGGRINLFF